MGDTKIEWADKSWNPVTGCTPISAGCRSCYARRMAKRLAGRYGYPKDDPFRPGTFHPDKIGINMFGPDKKVFVCSMGDFFHEAVTREMREYVYNVVEDHPDTLFLFLTKRPKNVMSYWIGERRNVWLGVTVCDDSEPWKIDTLRSIPAAVRFISFEPLLSSIENANFGLAFEECATPDGYGLVVKPKINWCIIGQETGPGARPAKAEWFNDIISQCREAGVPVFVKVAPPGVEIVREYPR